MNKTPSQQLIPGKLYKLNRHLHLYSFQDKSTLGTRVDVGKLVTFLYKKKMKRFSSNIMHYVVLYENILGTIAWYEERNDNIIETFLELV